jgi:hypothetical protein
MSLTKLELEANFQKFTQNWKRDLPRVMAGLDTHGASFLESYSRLASLNAWRANILEDQISTGSLEFFTEALNDALVSHVYARLGSWRSSLMSLRSCIENTCYCLFYKDHPIELRLWETGAHRPGFSEIHSYFRQHPDVKDLSDSPVTGLTVIKKEYGTLSRAVHASARNFRMAPDASTTLLWKDNAVSLAQWIRREQQSLAGLNLLLATLFRTELLGAQQQSLRKALSLVIPPSLHSRVRSELKVRVLSL